MRHLADALILSDYQEGPARGSVSQHLGQGQLWLVELGASFNLCLSPALLSGAFTRRSNS